MLFHKKSLFIILMLGSFVIILSRCLKQEKASVDPRGNVYAGAATCKQCHQAVYDSFLNSAHANTTSRGITQNMRGNFSNVKDSFGFPGGAVMVMEKRGDAYYQVIYQNGKENGAYKLDMLFGGGHAQTSAYWSNDQLYELPVSHYASANAWGTSPGYPADFIKLGRPIDENCLDCHSSNITLKENSTAGSDHLYDSSSVIYG